MGMRKKVTARGIRDKGDSSIQATILDWLRDYMTT